MHEAVALWLAGIREGGRVDLAAEGVVASIGSRQSQVNSRITERTVDINPIRLVRNLYTGTGFDIADLTRFIRSTACACNRLGKWHSISRRLVESKGLPTSVGRADGATFRIRMPGNDEHRIAAERVCYISNIGDVDPEGGVIGW